MSARNLLLALLAVVVGPLVAAAQEAAVRPGETLEGTLEASDATDGDGVSHDYIRMLAGPSDRILVMVESAEFQPIIEIGAIADGVFHAWASSDRAPVPAGRGVAGLFLPVDGEMVLRVFSRRPGHGSYTVRLREAAAGDSRPSELSVPARVTGSLAESDALGQQLQFEDAYRFTGRAGQRVLVAMSADFDGYLLLRRIGVSGATYLAADDDGYGGSDPFLEVDLREDGEYEVVATSFFQSTGDYELEVWTADPLAPAIAASPAAEAFFTAGEAHGLVVSADRVRHDLLGFDFPSPGAEFRTSDAAAAEIASAVNDPSLASWVIHDPAETAAVTVMAVGVGGPVTRSLFVTATTAAMGGMLQQSPEMADWRVTTPPTVDWGDRLFMWAAEDVDPAPDTDEPTRVDLLCRGSGAERARGLIVCLLGGATDGRSWQEQFSQLVIGDARRLEPSASKGGEGHRDVFSILEGSWDWEHAEDRCVANPVSISFSAPRDSMYITPRVPYEREDGTERPVTVYEIRQVTPTSIRGFITDETRTTDAGDLVVWDLVLRSSDSYCWRRTDWGPGDCTRSLLRCP